MIDAAESSPAYHRRKEARPAEILEAGLEEFYEHGFAGAKLARIAKRAGVSRATLYLYFDNKEALFDAVAEHAMGGFVAQVSASAETFEGPTAELLRQLLTGFYAMMMSRKNSAVMRILISEGQSRPDLVSRYHGLVLRRGRAALEKIIARGLARGDLRQSAATAIPQLVIAPALFYLIHTMVFDHIEKIDVNAYLDGHLDMLFNGVMTERLEG